MADAAENNEEIMYRSRKIQGFLEEWLVPGTG